MTLVEQLTYEEAIKMLVRIKDRINFEVTDSQKKMDALNMAIHLLESQIADGARAISREHFENRVREAVGLVEEELSDNFKDGIMMTLELLKTEPPVTLQPCEDAISREAVLDYIHRILNQGTGKKKSFEFIQKYVANMSSVKLQEQDRLAEGIKYCEDCNHVEFCAWEGTVTECAWKATGKERMNEENTNHIIVSDPFKRL